MPRPECNKGASCPFFAKGTCRFYHPPLHFGLQTRPATTERVASRRNSPSSRELVVYRPRHLSLPRRPSLLPELDEGFALTIYQPRHDHSMLVLKANMNRYRFQRLIYSPTLYREFLYHFIHCCQELNVSRALKLLYSQELIPGFNIFLHEPLPEELREQLVGRTLRFTPRFAHEDDSSYSFTFFQGEFDHNGNSRCQPHFAAQAYRSVADPPNGELALEIKRIRAQLNGTRQQAREARSPSPEFHRY